MSAEKERAHVFLVGELLAQVLAEARRRLTGVVSPPAQVERIARRRRRRQAPPVASAPESAEEFVHPFEEIMEELEREKERQEFQQRAEEARRMRDASDEKRSN